MFAGAQSQGSDWPSFLGPLGNSVSAEKGILAPWPAEGLRVLWHVKVGAGYGAPVVSRGRLFLFDRQGDDACLVCLDPGTGAAKWKFTYPTDYKDFFGYNNGPRCCPILDGNRVFIYGAEGMLHCLDASDGKIIWKIDTRAQFNFLQNFFGVGSTPLIEGDLLLVQVGGSPKGSVMRSLSDIASLKSDNCAVVAFDKASGKVRYAMGAELASYSSPVVATIEGRRWCFLLRAAASWLSSQLPARSIFTFPGAVKTWKASTRPIRWSSVIVSLFPKPMARAAPS